MNFEEALKKLGIEEYEVRIMNSNSNGELFHLYDYVELARFFTDKELFKELFKEIVRLAEEHWKRPESVFQHIPELLQQHITLVKNEMKA